MTAKLSSTDAKQISYFDQMNNDVCKTLIQFLFPTDLQRFTWASNKAFHATVHSANIIKPSEVRDFYC
ncbi:MAG: hypothetical protein COT84_00090 [Chlamydiae bacterium CG10_big_fil_rev_8_21_14_0_10_35_9]|nr:MAG: hypothetical protein COT84_00090 [Chlamydiae bacterium CG10_big_fil_rev_8_21_14_0_10_35_9]